MRNYRFSIREADFLDFEEERIYIRNPKTLHQINRVLRLDLEAPEEISFIDGINPQVYYVKALKIDLKEAIFKIIESTDSKRELKTKIVFFVPIIRPEAFEFMLRKLTELGLSSFIPIEFSRSQKVYVDKISSKNYTERLKEIIREATEQCQGAVFTKILKVQKLKDIVSSDICLKSTRFYASERLAVSGYMNTKLIENLSNESLSLLVGPEGGLTDDEVKILDNNGFQGLSLGPRLLKAETAAISLLSRFNLL
jgi:16S rRNA (uracil1498-N3)-methyltransferase